MRYILIVFALCFLSGCVDDFGLSNRLGRKEAIRTSIGKLYFYHLAWGLSTDAYFLSKKEDLCLSGLKEGEEVYFRLLGHVIYYETRSDSLFIYTNLAAVIPADFGFNIVQEEFGPFNSQEFEEKYKRGIIQKLVIDSLSDPGCNIKH